MSGKIKRPVTLDLALISQDTPSIRVISTGKSFSRFQLKVQDKEIVKELRCIEWRSKTEFPVAKVLFYKTLFKKRKEDWHSLEITFQNYPLTFLELPKMPLLQLAYVLRESMIGFERLYDRLGGFDISARMIKINKSGRCKIWCHENITINDPMHTASMSSDEFKKQILKIIEEKTSKSPLSKELFQGLYYSKTMIEGIYFLEKFCQEKNITIPHKLSIPTYLSNFQISKQIINKSEPRLPSFLRAKNQSRIKCESVESPKFNATNLSNDQSSVSGSIAKIRNTSKGCPFKKKFASKECTVSEKSQAFSRKIYGFPHKKTSLKKKCSIETYQTSLKTENCEKSLELEQKQKNKYILKKEGSQVFKFRKMSYQGVHLKGFGDKFRKNSDNTVVKKKKQEENKLLDSPPSSKESIAKDNPKIEQIVESPHYNILIRYAEKKDEQNNQEPNSWMKRITSLTAQKFRDTVFSRQEGADMLSQHLLAENNEIFSKMGTVTKGSILLNSFEL